MANKEVEVTIDGDGQISFDLDGFQGKGCAKLTKEIIKAMKATVVSRKQKADFYKPEQQTKQKISRRT